MDSPRHTITRVFALGSNGCGQLGIGHKNDVDQAQPAIFHSLNGDEHVGLHDDSINKIVGGGNHTLLLTRSGKLYWVGDTKTRVFLSGSPDFKETTDLAPRFYEFSINAAIRGAAGIDFVPPFHVQNITATFEASIVVVRDSRGKTRVWSCGIGNKGELGLGKLTNMNDLLLVDDFVPPGEGIVDLAASMSHVVAVLSNGEVWGWGAGRKGQLGAPIQNTILTPRKVDVPFSVQRAVCGTEFTCLFGHPQTGDFTILGSDKHGIKANAPTKERIILWKDVGASFGSIYVLMPDGTVECWGRNDKGQLPPDNLASITDVSIGSEHVVALDVAGKVRAWGWNEHGNCGPDNNARDGLGLHGVLAVDGDLGKLTSNPDARITGIAAGWATSWVIVEEPRVSENIPLPTTEGSDAP